MLKKRLEIAERNQKRLELVVARFAHVVEAARTFVEAQAPLGRDDFAGDKFQELERAVRRLLPPSAPGPG